LQKYLKSAVIRVILSHYYIGTLIAFYYGGSKNKILIKNYERSETMAGTIMTNLAAWLWGWPIIIIMLGTGLIYTIASKGFQFRYLGYAIGQTFGKVLKKEELENARTGVLSPREAVSIAIGGTVGVGNIGGVATAIAVGGPGAVFWMWIAALFGMLLKMIEVTLALHYRTKDSEGKPFGGPMYYIHNGIGKDLHLPAIAKVLNVLFIGGMIGGMVITMQCYNVSEAVATTFSLNQSIIAIIYTIILYVMISGGLKKLDQIASMIVPFMCVLYLVAGLAIIIIKCPELGNVFYLIFHGAFHGTAAVGGFGGAAFILAINKGLARAVFSSEAGEGTSPMIHSTAATDHPIRQGMWGVFEVFVDTILVCSVTALTILCTGVWTSGISGASLTLSAFNSVFGVPGQVILTVAIVLFGITTSSGWYTYYDIILRYLFGSDARKDAAKKKVLTVYKFIYPLCGLWLVLYANAVGMPTAIVWNFADVATGIPTLINVFALLLLLPKFIQLLNDFKARFMGIGKVDPNVKVFYEDEEPGRIAKEEK
jgi:AGCS family alanine or glycine:cation symporter